MSTQPRKFPALVLVASLCALCAAPLQAAQYCVHSMSQLLLASAAQTAEDDDVRLRSGTYTYTLIGVDSLLDAGLFPLEGSPVLHTGSNVDRGARESTRTAIATDANGPDRGSSCEFSACVEYASIDVFPDGFEP